MIMEILPQYGLCYSETASLEQVGSCSGGVPFLCRRIEVRTHWSCSSTAAAILLSIEFIIHARAEAVNHRSVREVYPRVVVGAYHQQQSHLGTVRAADDDAAILAAAKEFKTDASKLIAVQRR
jgi:hypothetical protein